MRIKEVKNYTLLEFLRKPEEIQIEYSRLLSFSQPLQTKKTLWDLKLKHIDELRSSKLQDFEVIVKTIARLQGIKKREAWKIRITEFFRLFNAMKEQLEEVANAEKALIPVNVNIKWDLVEGSKKLEKFGIYNTLLPLAKQLNKTIEEVNDMIYQEVFLILLRNKTIEDINYEMNQIKLPR